jgi:hypothetical protein
MLICSTVTLLVSLGTIPHLVLFLSDPDYFALHRMAYGS